ncbi:unnamed protein product [Adineta ricciae]|uniref:NAD(P)(+)--arginine ADP-ribosyltransferase n=1 Tax=Adineta ricciae TaxID=249248 RepID=A0A815EHH2_ADIRI|nr:unnamed protein product [Adineta ricciae]CAF1311946.1 unnamed protein product [Adineta ricciae]
MHGCSSNDISLPLVRLIAPELVASNGDRTFDKQHYPGNRMIANWRNRFLGKREALEGNEWRVAEAALKGIMEVGKEERCDQKVYCVRLYTRSVFVNRVTNQALRNNDESKAEALVPFCYLLRQHIYSPSLPVYRGTMFRGCQLETSMIDQYREMVGRETVSWLGFTSTSKSLKIAKAFGCNTIFVIDLSEFTERFRYGRPVDISSMSMFPDEDEVLLPAGFGFTVKKVEQNLNDNLTYIDICGIAC